MDIKKVADEAEMIINGYAFTHGENNWIRGLNLNNTDKALVFSNDKKIIETTMDDIEARIAMDYYFDNTEFLEVNHA